VGGVLGRGGAVRDVVVAVGAGLEGLAAVDCGLGKEVRP
jgi:hypothetical protein